MPAISLNTSHFTFRYVCWPVFLLLPFTAPLSRVCYVGSKAALLMEQANSIWSTRRLRTVLKFKSWEVDSGLDALSPRSNFISHTDADLSTRQMFLPRMASKPLFYFSIWVTAAAFARPVMSSLPSEVTSLIPPCALGCFQSFVSSNYDEAACGSLPSLLCLCQTTGSSGFTIGEGATQCLAAEVKRNVCQGDDASRE